MFDKLNEDQIKVLRMWLIFGIIIFLIALLVIYKFNKKEENNKNEDEISSKNYSLVSDYNRYYTVKSTIEKYYSYINLNDYEDVLLILSDDYKKSNNININNISNYIVTSDSSISYESNIMCNKMLSKGVISYLVKGKTILSNKGSYLSDNYYNVILDNNNFTFSISPITKEEFEGDCHA